MKHKFAIFKKYINVSCETLEKLIIYSELLCFWQKKMNLISNNSLQDAEIRHFLDSAQLFVFCKNSFVCCFQAATYPPILAQPLAAIL